MKSITCTLTYPGATVDQVATMLGDPAFREAVCKAQHVVRQTITITQEGSADQGKTVVMEQVQSTQGVPGFAKKIVGEETTLVTEETWSSATEGAVNIVIPGKPGQMTGTVRLDEAGGTTTETLNLEITVGIPLVGGKIEGLLAGLMTDAMKKENQVGLEWLSR